MNDPNTLGRVTTSLGQFRTKYLLGVPLLREAL